MQVRFVHAADIHLGYEQYNLAKRADDFARAYLAMVAHAIEVQADFVLIAGDLFHKANADAWTLKQAMLGLEQLRAAAIPVVAIEGNHDAQHYHKNLSWMEFLAHQDLLFLLNVHRASNGLKSLQPYDPVEGGSWLDLAGARIYGVKYYGAATARLIEDIHGQIEPGPAGYTILMLHAGLEGQVPHLHGGLTLGQLASLRPPLIDYLALGHIHKRLVLHDWLYNPGSTEVNSMEEMEWPHGFFDVQVDTDRSPKHKVTAIQTPSLRPFRRISVSAEDCKAVDEFVARVEERIVAESAVPEGAVIELHLGGVASFRRQDVPLERLKSQVEVRFAPLVARVRNSLVPPGLVTHRNRERLPRTELEREIIEQLVYQQGEYRDRAAAWTRLVLDVKRMAAEKNEPAVIADHVQATLRSLATEEEDSPLPADVVEVEGH